jgi:hypothetical protein
MSLHSALVSDIAPDLAKRLYGSNICVSAIAAGVAPCHSTQSSPSSKVFRRFIYSEYDHMSNSGTASAFERDGRFAGLGITFDDVLLLPAKSDVIPR